MTQGWCLRGNPDEQVYMADPLPISLKRLACPSLHQGLSLHPCGSTTSMATNLCR